MHLSEAQPVNKKICFMRGHLTTRLLPTRGAADVGRLYRLSPCSLISAPPTFRASRESALSYQSLSTNRNSSTMASTSATKGRRETLNLRNELDKSRSPYVSFITCFTTSLQLVLTRLKKVRAHMNNPVAWQEWKPETLALAKKHDRLLFVSIGYAACHCRSDTTLVHCSAMIDIS